jgi:hypothetical protein
MRNNATVKDKNQWRKAHVATRTAPTRHSDQRIMRRRDRVIGCFIAATAAMAIAIAAVVMG